jgi:putative peptidyl-prolyl cis-trans isomerase
MRTNLTILIVILALIASDSSLFAKRESLNQILAIVGNTSISQIDFESGSERYKIISRFAPPYRKKLSFRSQVIDFLIDRAIVDIVAEEESVQVNEKRIEAEIEKRMESMGITDIEQFKRSIPAQTSMSYDQWLQDLPYQIKKGQLLQIRVSTPLPSEQELRSWYNQNKAKVGLEVKFREIAIAPKDSSIEEESRVYKEITEIRAKVMKDPSVFRLIASGPRNDSRYKASSGFVNWVPTFELFKQSSVLATITSQTKQDKISEIYRDERKRYCILYMEGSRPTPLDSVKRGIQNVLYREKEQKAFEDWLQSMRNNVSITTYDPIYNKEHNVKILEETYNLD